MPGIYPAIFTAIAGSLASGDTKATEADPITAILRTHSLSIMYEKPTTATALALFTELEQLCKANEHLPSAISAYCSLGMLAKGQGREDYKTYLEKAMRLYEATKDNGIPRSLHLGAGVYYKELGREKESIQALSLIANDDSEYADFANERLVLHYMHAGERAKAKESFDKITSSFRKYSIARRFGELGVAEALRQAATEHRRARAARVAEWGLPPIKRFERFSPDSIEHESARTTVTMRIVYLAVHLVEQFRMRYGRYPQSLEEANERIHVNVPPDPYRPESPLQYERGKDRVYIWSVGPDGKDDHHRMRWEPGRANGDIVFSRLKD